MIKEIPLCTECVQIITNPICPYCFAREVILWLRDKNIPAYNMKNIQRYLRAIIREAEDTPSHMRCILCKSKRVNFCTYCFTNKASRVIEKNLNDPEILENFKEDFNTEIWLLGYNQFSGSISPKTPQTNL